jgi:SAM-dependent MidA family methyltransferase
MTVIHIDRRSKGLYQDLSISEFLPNILTPLNYTTKEIDEEIAKLDKEKIRNVRALLTHQNWDKFVAEMTSVAIKNALGM